MKGNQVPFYGLMIVLSLAVSGCAAIPAGREGEDAEKIADRLLQAANERAWMDTAAVSFRFRDSHFIFWDRKRSLAETSNGSVVIQFDTKGLRGLVIDNGKRVEDPEKIRGWIEKGRSWLVNDTYWLNPVFHIRAPGAKRMLTDDGQLRVTFESGGVTPGDSYVFSFDDTGLITEMKMWVQVFPIRLIRGARVSFSDYITTSTGVKIPLHHKVSGMIEVNMSDVVTYAAYPDKTEDRFDALLKILGR